jgi:hypothetical protein
MEGFIDVDRRMPSFEMISCTDLLDLVICLCRSGVRHFSKERENGMIAKHRDRFADARDMIGRLELHRVARSLLREAWTGRPRMECWEAMIE